MFEYSAWPGRYATPAAGLILWGTGCWIAWELWCGKPTVALSAGTALLFVLLGSALWIGKRGTIAFPLLRRYAVNLEAVRPSATTPQPQLWLVAHIDSKSQRIPMLVRICGVVLCITAWIALIALWVASAVTSIPSLLFVTLALLSAIGALPLIGALVGTQGTGALDNASGVATILTALEYLDPALPIGVLVTSAEELGLAGARAWLEGMRDRHPHPLPLVINCDSIDDHGQLVCMRPRKLSHRLDDILRIASRTIAAPLDIRGVLPGVLVDAVAFTQVSWPALTVSRGGWRSLARIHTDRDDLLRMTGSGIDEAARFVAQLVKVVIAKHVSC